MERGSSVDVRTRSWRVTSERSWRSGIRDGERLYMCIDDMWMYCDLISIYIYIHQ